MQGGGRGSINQYFPWKGFVDPPQFLPPSPCIKNVQKYFFPILDNKINLTPKNLFIFNHAGPEVSKLGRTEPNFH